MVKNYAVSSPAEVRRKDREVADDAWIAALLRRAPLGTLATVYEGRPFVNTNIFVFSEAERAIYMHTARGGRTRTNVDAAEDVCFSVSEMGRLLPSDRAFSMSVEYNGVVVFGRAIVITDDEEKERALQMLVDKYFPHLLVNHDYAPPDDGELTLTAVYRIDIDEWSGKAKTAPADHPGAFMYGDQEAPR